MQKLQQLFLKVFSLFQVVLHEKGKQPKIKELYTVDDDLQTQYIRTSASSFEFRAHVENAGCIEGLLRYHPFLYDKETFPMHDFEQKPGIIDGHFWDESIKRKIAYRHM